MGPNLSSISGTPIFCDLSDKWDWSGLTGLKIAKVWNLLD